MDFENKPSDESAAVRKSISYDQDEILRSILELHCPDGFECDLTYGNGAFYKNITKPKHKYDLRVLADDVIESCSTKIPHADCSLHSIVFDPPFLTYIKDGNDSIMARRFSGYWTYDQLSDHYRKTIIEAGRVLKRSGVFVFKCQDIIHNHKMYCTHNNVINWCGDTGFRLLDLYVLLAKSRMPVNKRGKQKHARVYHSYFLVFLKTA